MYGKQLKVKLVRANSWTKIRKFAYDIITRFICVTLGIKTKLFIPRNTPYCYSSLGLCPYWDNDLERPSQQSGYCHYMKEGDWMPAERGETSEIIYVRDGFTDVKVGDKVAPISLLWDQCKECGISQDCK